jgi:hypothetical protein
LRLERSIDNLAKRLDRLDPIKASINKINLDYWKSKLIIPLYEWIKFRDTPHALDYFPDDFDRLLTCFSEDEFGEKKREDVRKWNLDFHGLMEHTKNPNYGRLKCFHCLLSPDGDDPIFIGINRLVAKGLVNRKYDPLQYPCKVVDRFRCPYERTDGESVMNSAFDVEDLFKLEKLAFAVEISFAKARKEDSMVGVRNKEELLNSLTDKETFTKILEQGSEAPEVGEYIRTYLAENHDYILDYFMKIKDKVNSEELRFY